ncbi:MAG: hypothetical protein WC783_02020 [Candidatus Paceibacterota bacterium]|jgi:hypothetical protein
MASTPANRSANIALQVETGTISVPAVVVTGMLTVPTVCALHTGGVMVILSIESTGERRVAPQAVVARASTARSSFLNM